MRRVFSFLACFVLVFCAYPAVSETAKTPLIILLYMTGSDLESKGGAASADLEEIMAFLPQDRNIRVIAMISGSDVWQMDIAKDETSIYEIANGSLTAIHRQGSRSMGDPDTLSGFLSFSVEHYPAERYGLILWDHGAGPMMGVCFDETYKTGNEKDHLTLEELQQALSSSPFSGRKLAFIGFDACLMAALEVASAMAPYAEYMIASQETEPPAGWDYVFLRDIHGDESGAEIGAGIVKTYEASMGDSCRAATLSCLDLSRTGAVMDSLDRLFSGIEINVTPASYPDHARIRADSKVFGTFTTSDYDLVDLIDLLEMFQDNDIADCSEAISLIRDMVISRFAAGKDEYVHGVSIYYPFDNKHMYESSWASLYSHMTFIPGYQSYIKQVSDLYMGEQLLDWRSDYHLEIMEKAGSVHLAIQLTPEEIQNAVRARLIVVEEIQQGTYQHIFYADGGRIRKTDEEIAADYHGEALYMVSSEGEILAGPVSWYPVDGGICVYGVAEYAIDWDHFDWTRPMDDMKFQDAVRLIYQTDEKGRLSFTDLIILSDAQDGMNLPSSTPLDSFSELKIINTGMTSVTTLEHQLLDDSFSFRVLMPNEAPRLKFLPVFDGNDRYAYIRITDAQGNTICSEARKIVDPARISLAREQLCAEWNGIQVTLRSVDLITGIRSGIKCVFHIRNGSDSFFQLSVQRAVLEEAELYRPTWHRTMLASGEEDEFVVFIDGNAIRDSGVQEAEKMNITLGLTDENGTTESIDAVADLRLNAAIFSVVEREKEDEH